MPRLAACGLLDQYEKLRRAVIVLPEALRVSTEQLLLAAPIPLMLGDESGCCRYANPASGELLRMPVDKLVGRPFAELTVEASRFADAYRSAAEESRVHLELLTRRGDGSLLMARWDLAGLRDEQGRARAVLASVSAAGLVAFGEVGTRELCERVAALTTVETDLAQFIDLALERLLAILGRSGGAVVLLDATTGRTRLVASHGLSPEVERQVERQGPQASRRRDGCGLETVPLEDGGQLLGVLAVVPDSSGFAERDAEILHAIANIIAGAAARLKAADRETLVPAIGAHLRESLDPDAVLRAAMAALGPALGADRCFVLLGATGQSQVVTHEWDAAGITPLGSAKPALDTLIDLAVRERRAVTSTEPSTGWTTGAADRQRGDMAQSTMLAPLLIGADIVGFVVFQQVVRPRDWTAEDRVLVERVADQLALAVHQARLHKVAERERARLAGVLAALPAAVYTVGLDGRVIEANPAAGYLAGSSPGALAGRLCREAFPLHDEAGRLLCSWACPLERRGDPPVGGVVRAFLPGGESRSRSVHWDCAPFRDADGNLLGWVEVVRDVSQLQEVEAMRQTFLSAVSHELLTPVAIIKGHAETLRDSATRANASLAEAALAAIDQETDRLRRLVANVLDAARAASGAFVIERAPVDLRPAVIRSIQRFRSRSRRHELVTELPDQVPLVLGDRERLEGIIYNLLDNAIKYSPRGGRVVVRAVVHTDQVEVVVEDQGIGIRHSDLERIFEPYYRAQPEARPGIDGSGLGLYVCKTIVEAHGGHIWAESMPGRGTAVHFTIPRLAAAQLPELVPRPRGGAG